jgi:hypothetical protein
LYSHHRQREKAAVVSYLFLQNSEQPNLEFPFDYNNASAMDVLRKAFHGPGLDRWKQCAEEAMNCCKNMEQEDLVRGIEFKIYFRT